MNGELEEFKTEILEILDNAEKALLEFDRLPNNLGSCSLYDEVFRAYHNIKGAAGMMEWAELQSHVHQLENVLMQSKATVSIPKHLIGWFLKGNDATRAILANEKYDFDYETSSTAQIPAPLKNVIPDYAAPDALPEEFFSEMTEGLDKISSALIKMEANPADKGLLDFLYREIHSIKGAVQLFGLVEASQLSHAMESSLESIKQGNSSEMEKGHVSTLLMSVDLMGQCFHHPVPPEVIKEVNFMMGLLEPFCEANVKDVKIAEEEIIVAEEKKQLPFENHPSPSHSDVDKADSSIRVQVSLLDRLMTLMGEMVLVRNQVLQYSSKTDDLEFLNLSQKLDVVTSELQEETMKTRMQPIGNILSKFQRVVRDLSGSLGKKINLVLHGVETELDKTLIEAVKDPLTHIVRNACDHGIEIGEIRTKAGKAETGTITIKAYHEGGLVIVDISDDGQGLCREKLLKKAIEKGIVDAAIADKMSDREVNGLIFAPGFSTAEKVTNVSGRGVGMDVVKSNIERIGGLVDISSVQGQGTKITLKIPLTLAIVPAMIIRCENDRFAIPQVKLVELVRVEKTVIEYVQGIPVFRLRGNILPLLNLKEILGIQNASDNDGAINIVVLNSDSHHFGMIVDEILDTADIVVKPLAKFLKTISIYSGATVLGDGKVAFILDVLGIAQKHLGTGTHAELRNLADKYSDLATNELEIREYVLVKLGSKTKHAIPLGFVSRMEEVKTSTIEMSGVQRVIRYRGGVLKIVSLNEVFGYPHSRTDSEITQLIVAKVEETLYGFEVDQIIDVLSTRDHLDCSLSSHEAIIGNLVTQDEIIVVVDVEKVHELSRPIKVRKINSGARRILLVEDTDSIRHRVAAELIDSGYDVVEAIDGVEGLRKIVDSKFAFDLIISDIEMPKMNGYEFAKKVRGINQLKDVPIIAFSTKNSSADIQLAKSAGFSSYLEKSKGKLLPLLVNECLSKNQRKLA